MPRTLHQLYFHALLTQRMYDVLFIWACKMVPRQRNSTAAAELELSVQCHELEPYELCQALKTQMETSAMPQFMA